MRILLLTPGTGSFLCGSCIRDNLLTTALRRLGHDAQIVPLYLPFQLESAYDAGEAPNTAGHATSAAASDAVHMGGINVYLQQLLPLLARLPRAVRKWLNRESLLRWASTKGDMTNPAALGSMTISMLKGEEGRQKAEIERLLTWLADQPAPDVVLLSNAMLTGLARRLQEELDVPVVCTLQGEQPFLDALHLVDSKRCWEILSERARTIDGFVAVSHYTAELMTGRMNLDPAKVHVARNGIEFDGYEPPSQPAKVPTIGFLARMCDEKGLKTLVEAFLLLRERNRVPNAQLVIVGVQLPEDRKFVRGLELKIERAGAKSAVRFHANVSRTDKIALLQSMSVLSVPAAYGESFGLYLLEAMACAVPVVQPRQSGFTEILEDTGGGILYDPEDAEGLVHSLEELLLDPVRASELGARGADSVRNEYTSDRMAQDVVDVCAKLCAGDGSPV
jgi:glycosyltransferase involved in cell wall biosynthesis